MDSTSEYPTHRPGLCSFPFHHPQDINFCPQKISMITRLLPRSKYNIFIQKHAKQRKQRTVISSILSLIIKSISKRVTERFPLYDTGHNCFQLPSKICYPERQGHGHFLVMWIKYLCPPYFLCDGI